MRKEDIELSLNEAYGELELDTAFLSPMHTTIYDTIPDTVPVNIPEIVEIENDDEVQITINMESNADRHRLASTRIYEEVPVFVNQAFKE